MLAQIVRIDLSTTLTMSTQDGPWTSLAAEILGLFGYQLLDEENKQILSLLPITCQVPTRPT
jgi:hypothetical protein